MVAPFDASRPAGESGPRDEWESGPPGRIDPAGSPADRAALQRILQQSIAFLDRTETLAPVEHELLLGVARRYPGAELSCEPIARELVSAALTGFFAGARHGSLNWASTPAALIARSLCDHPAARQRLEALWEQLQGQIRGSGGVDQAGPGGRRPRKDEPGAGAA